LIERDGFLFQSPISWYTRERRWDLAPGYEKQNRHFDRPAGVTCLYCHANRVEPVDGPANRYRRPIFQGYAIGCERCHGPGALHVQRPVMVDGRDITIVNPAHLEPSRRDAVCEQCHLFGEQRIIKLDRRDHDFRPGLSFDRVWSVFVRTAGATGDRFVGQVEQMRASRCYRASQGRLGCISCHDPHDEPAPEERVRYYRERCLECHADQGCRLPVAARRQQSPDDDCAGCHMPRSNSTDIIHAAATNHRILRQADGDERSPEGAGGPRDDSERSLLLFHREQMDERQRCAAHRDLGVALARGGPDDARRALPHLEAALAARPDDVLAWEAKGFALDQLGRLEQGLDAFQEALVRQPDNEAAVIGAANLAARAGRLEEAIPYWRRAIAINPWRSDYHRDLAIGCFNHRDWPAAAAACRDALRLNPTDLKTRRLLVRCELHLRNLEAARAEFQTLLQCNPPDREELIRWFAPLSRSPSDRPATP
jgi:Tfp pilus assembly protein PilF